MRVVTTLQLGGDTDLLEAQLLFHLNAGVDAIVLDGDAVALSAQEGDPRVVRAPASELTRAAVTELGADWIIPASAREFWWPRGASFREILSRIPPDFDVVQAIVRPFLSVEGQGDDLSAYRLSPQAMLDEPGSPLRATRRLVHRAGVDASTYEGGIVKSALRPLRGWYPIEVLWFPDEPRVSAADVETGLGGDVVQLDSRLRDAVRALRAGNTLVFERPSVVDNARFAVDAAVLGEGDAFRLRGELDVLERRLAEMEANIGVRLERKLRTLMRRGGGKA